MHTTLRKPESLYLGKIILLFTGALLSCRDQLQLQDPPWGQLWDQAPILPSSSPHEQTHTRADVLQRTPSPQAFECCAVTQLWFAAINWKAVSFCSEQHEEHR